MKSIAAQPFHLPCAKILIRLDHSPGGCQQQGPGMGCRGIVQHARGVGQNHAALGGGRQIEVVEADRVVGNNLQLRPGGVQQFAVDRVGHQRQQGVAAFGLGLQLRFGQRAILVVNLDIEMLLQLVDVRLRYQSGYKYTLAFFISPFRCCLLVQAACVYDCRLTSIWASFS